MLNVMLDELPDMWEVYPIETDFRIGIQIHQILEDKDLTDYEKYISAADLLFKGVHPDPQYYSDAVMWFMSGWNHDNSGKSKDRTRVLDYDIDQWRLYSAFRSQYGINLNTANMHYWEFMGLLTTLDKCAFTRVVDIRLQKETPKMGKEAKAALKKAKDMYRLEQPDQKVSEEVKQKTEEALKRFEEMRKAKS